MNQVKSVIIVGVGGHTKDNRSFSMLLADKGVHIFHCNAVVREQAHGPGKFTDGIIDANGDDAGN